MSRVYLDTMIWMYRFEDAGAFGAVAATLLNTLRGNNHTTLSSLLVLSELLVLPRRNGDQLRESLYKNALLSESITSVAYTAAVVESFAELRAVYRIPAMDALHLAYAAAAGADFFVTEDRKLLGTVVPGIGLVCTMAKAISSL